MLGIIGVVASMTMPALIQKKINRDVEVRLMKFYSVMNQVIKMAEIDYGEKENWNFAAGSKYVQETYFLPYMTNVAKKEFNAFDGENIAIYFNDGSMYVTKGTYDYFYFPFAKNFNSETFSGKDKDGNYTPSRPDSGIKYFPFAFLPNIEDSIYSRHFHKGLEPYQYHLSDTTYSNTNIKKGCTKDATQRNFCTAWIQSNNWKIPKDYPLKVK